MQPMLVQPYFQSNALIRVINFSFTNNHEKGLIISICENQALLKLASLAVLLNINMYKC